MTEKEMEIKGTEIEVYSEKERKSTPDYLPTGKVKISQGVYTKVYSFQKLIDLSKSEVYINRCMNRLVESIYKKPFTDKTSQRIKDLFPVSIREVIGFNQERTGNNFLEVVTVGGKTVEVYASEVQSWQKGIRPYTDAEILELRKEFKALTKEELDQIIKNGVEGYWQNKGNKKNELFLEAWSNDPETGSLSKDGHYVYHLMKYAGNMIYGEPDWIPAQISIQLVTFAKKHNLSIFVNNIAPRKIIIVKRGKDVKMTPEKKAKVKDFFKANFDKIENSNKTLIFETTDAEIKVEDVIKGNMEGDFMSLDNQAKLDICNSTGVPPILVGLQFAGKLGATQEMEVTVTDYYEDTVKPKRNSFINMILDLCPEEDPAEIEEIYIPKVTTEAEGFTKAVKDMYTEAKQDLDK